MRDVPASWGHKSWHICSQTSILDRRLEVEGMPLTLVLRKQRQPVDLGWTPLTFLAG